MTTVSQSVPRPIEVEVVAVDGSSAWRSNAVLLKHGRGDPTKSGGEGWVFAEWEGLHWWAAPDEWRELSDIDRAEEQISQRTMVPLDDAIRRLGFEDDPTDG